MQDTIYTSDDILQMLQSTDVKQENLGFKILYQKYYGLIESLVVKNNGQKEDVKEIFHDGLMALYQQVNKENFELTAQLQTYLYSICRNKWLMKLRKRKNSKELSLNDDYEWIPMKEDINTQIELSEGQKVLTTVLEQLGEDCKKLIRLYYFLKLKMKKIAEQLNIPNEAAAKNRKARCLKKLRSLVLENPKYQKYLKDYLSQIAQ